MLKLFYLAILIFFITTPCSTNGQLTNLDTTIENIHLKCILKSYRNAVCVKIELKNKSNEVIYLGNGIYNNQITNYDGSVRYTVSIGDYSYLEIVPVELNELGVNRKKKINFKLSKDSLKNSFCIRVLFVPHSKNVEDQILHDGKKLRNIKAKSSIYYWGGKKIELIFNGVDLIFKKASLDALF